MSTEAHIPDPYALIGRPLRLLMVVTLMARGKRVLPLTRTWHELANGQWFSHFFEEDGRRAPIGF